MVDLAVGNLGSVDFIEQTLASDPSQIAVLPCMVSNLE
jgi:hypothetical protein